MTMDRVAQRDRVLRNQLFRAFSECERALLLLLLLFSYKKKKKN